MAYFIASSILSQGVYTGILSAISTITIRTCQLITRLYKCTDRGTCNVIKRLDIERKLALIESVIRSMDIDSSPDVKQHSEPRIINDYKPISVPVKGLAMVSSMRDSMSCKPLAKVTNTSSVRSLTDGKHPDPIEVSLTHLRDIINEVHRNIDTLTNKIEYHNSKYFNAMRTLNIEREREDLEINAKILDERYNDFMKIISVMKK